jgi:serine/threonine-protein phosphatase 4 catalytic subunit
MEVSDLFPIASVIENQILCVHGGLSPDLHSLEDIARIERKQEPPSSGPFCDLLWSDPDDIVGFKPSPRGVGFLFGGDVVKAFLEQAVLKFICRAHQLMMDGYGVIFDETLATVWSAPNYCYRSGNLASILEFDENLTRSFRVYEAVPSEAQGEPGTSEYWS